MTASFLAKARGVIHVGASNGQERFTYAEHGLPVVWIEALPESYQQLVKNIQEFAHQSAVQALLTDVVGKTYPFKISNNNGESSSILDLAEHRAIWPTVDYVGQIDLVSTTLDQLVNDHIFNPAHFDALVLDTQGSELLVLKGAESILKHINFLKVEAANFNAYMGCTTVAELTKWLQSQGYRLTQHHAFANHPAGGQYFDLYFERACDTLMLARAADELHALASAFDAIGLADVSYHLALASSALDGKFPEPNGWWSGPFNGQDGRKQLVLEILNRFKPMAILETGTYRGTTTRFLAENFPGPVHTCELDLRWYRTAQRSFREFPSINAVHGDSRHFLARQLAETNGPFFLYLDAHWGQDLPLANEIELIISSGKEVVILIDDFAVPGDDGYGFDDYGPGKRLTIELLSTIDPKESVLFFPTLPSGDETGAKRGCAVIAIGHAISILAQFDSLRQTPWPSVGFSQRSLPTPQVTYPAAPIRSLIESAQLQQDYVRLVIENSAMQRDRIELRDELKNLIARRT